MSIELDRVEVANLDWMENANGSVSNRIFDRKAVMRLGVDRCHTFGLGVNRSWFGPIRGRSSTQECFLEGRGQVYCRAPECDSRYLPESLFPPQCEVGPTCCDTTLQPIHTRIPRGCNGIIETSMEPYVLFPGAHIQEYQGYDKLRNWNVRPCRAEACCELPVPDKCSGRLPF